MQRASKSVLAPARLCYGAIGLASVLSLSTCRTSSKPAIAPQRAPAWRRSTVPLPANPPSANDPITRCASAATAALSAQIDDFEGPTPDPAWFSYRDATPGGVLLRSTELATPGQHALHVTAAGFRDWGSGFGLWLGLITSEQRACEVDASAYSGLRFRARGSGSLRVAVASTAMTPIADGGSCQLGQACYDWPGEELRLTSEWATFEVRFCALAPAGWGRPSGAVDPAQLFALHFRLAPNQGHDLWLDDLAFLPRSSAQGAERCGPACPAAAAAGAVLDPGRLSAEHAPAGLTVHTFEQRTKSCGAITRRYLSYVPERLSARSSAPVLIGLHGHGSSAENFRDLQTHGRFEALSERDGFIVVYGNAAPGAASSARVPNSGAWVQSPSPTDEVDDVAYLDAVLADLRQRGVIDGNNRVFLVGQSNGGGMVIEAARQHPDRYAGLAALMPYAGLPLRLPTPVSPGPLSRMLFAYSLTDPGLPPDYATTLRALANSWATALGIPAAIVAAPSRTALPDRVDEGASYAGSLTAALSTRHSQCEQFDFKSPGQPSSAPRVRLLVFDHAGHFWPNPAPDTAAWVLETWGLRNQDIDAADAVWAFFQSAATTRAQAK